MTGDASRPILSRPCAAAMSLHLSHVHALQNVQPGVVTLPDTLSTLRQPALSPRQVSQTVVNSNLLQVRSAAVFHSAVQNDALLFITSGTVSLIHF